ncbi:MAG: TIM barrel protein [Pirellulales bacterium]
MHNVNEPVPASPGRRDFLRMTALSGIVATALPTGETMADEKSSATKDVFCAFTESFQDWPIEKVCAKFKAVGLDGLDLTVRPGGHIDPKDAKAKLPPAAAAAAKHGVEINMLTTAITDADADAEVILGTCGELGIGRVKLGYYRTARFGKLLKEIDESRRRLEGVAKLARKYGVLPCVHIHSGDTIPASGPVAYLLLRDFAPAEIGAYVDPMHMTIEGGIGGWRQSLDLLAPWIAISSLKNCLWQPQARDDRGQIPWRVLKCPLADGVAPIPDYLQALRDLGYRGLYTLHSEYRDRNSWKELTIDQCLDQTVADFAYARRFLA